MSQIERWADAKIECSLDAIGEALSEGIGIMLGVFEDVESTERFLAVYQNLTRRWIRSIAEDFSMEWAMFVDGFADGDYKYLAEPKHLGRLEVEIEGRRAVVVCPIQYFFAPGEVEEINVHPNLDHPSSACLVSRQDWEDFILQELDRVTRDILTLHPEVWEKSMEEVEKRHDILSYYEQQVSNDAS
jgi:hypothetical protein